MATAARERGNALYKQSKLPEAIKCYEEAASLAPDDPAPISNLSAAKFEMGQYEEAAELAERALSLTVGESPSKDKLYLRLARCHLHCLQAKEARFALEQCGELPGRDSIAESLAVADGVQPSGEDVQKLRRYVLDRMPRYKPCLQDEPEYYPMGHDTAESLFDRRLAAQSNRNSSLSFLFCGIGDARHLWETLNRIAMRNAGSGNTHVPKELHFTLVDLKPASLARILIVLRLLSQLPNEKYGSPASEDITWVIAYLYVGHVVPPFVYATLSRVMSDLIGILEENSPDNPLLKWVIMSEDTWTQVLLHLRLWSKPLDDLYRPENVRKYLVASIRDDKMLRKKDPLMGQGPTPATCEEDEATFDRFAITPPPEAFARRHEPQIVPLLKLTRSKNRAPKKKARDADAFDSYINQNWKTNMTLIDLVWEAKNERNSRLERPEGLEWTKLTGIGEEPVSLLPDILGDENPAPIPGRKGVIELLAAYFFVVGLSLRHALGSSKLRLEMIAGEMTDTMERIRYNLLDARADKSSSVTLPQRFDRIHMSNIPDYVGGILAPLEYAQPLLKDGSASFQYNCLLNPPKFKSQEHFLSEHLLMCGKQEIRDHFCAEMFDQYDGEFDMPGMDFYLGQNYWAWKLSNAPTKLPWDKLMPRARLERWLYAHFLKICLPAKRDIDDGAPVYAPLNLTAFMRLIVRLGERGYPSHWLGAVIENLTSGAIKTTARAPRKEAMDVDDVRKLYPAKQITVAPWVAEFTTLVATWRGLMPFGFVVTDGAHVTLADVWEYSVAFPDFNVQRVQLCIPHFVLVFHNKELVKLPQSLRTTLLDDEVGDNSEQANKARAEGLHVVATFKYVTDTRTASFWMRQDIVDRLRQGDWSVSIWRTDSWTKQVNEVPVSSHLAKGRPWS